MTYACMECGRKFKSERAAERASREGCPGCGGVDIDLDTRDLPTKETVACRPKPTSLSTDDLAAAFWPR